MVLICLHRTIDVCSGIGSFSLGLLDIFEVCIPLRRCRILIFPLIEVWLGKVMHET